MNVTKNMGLFIVICLIMTLKMDASAVIYSTTGGVSSSNIHKQNYPCMWAVPTTSFLYEKENGNIIRVEYISKTEEKAAYILVEEYKSDYSFVSSKTIAMELETFGGFFAGKQYNYFVFGQNNPAESDEVEVMRIIRYDKNFNRIDIDSLYGANTSRIFGSAACRLSEYGDMLYIRTAHSMYKSSDGLNHQANMTVAYQQSTGKITDSFTCISNRTWGYVSHSFNQFIDCSNGKIIAVDHGDASPRAVVLQEYPLPAGQTTFVTNKEKVKNQIMLDIYGRSGDNDTGVCVGGFEQSDSHYIVVGNSMLQNENGEDGRRNIFVSTVAKDNVANEEAQVKWITDYSLTDLETASTPQIVKISENRFLLLWETWLNYENEDMSAVVNPYDGFACYKYEMKCALLDGTGSPISKVCSYYGSLSDCKPILYNNRVVWYVTDDGTPQFYSLPIDGSEEKLPNGAVVRDDQGNCFVRINTDKKTAEFIEPVKPIATTIIVPDEVTVSGEQYKVTTLEEGSLDSFISSFSNNCVKKVVIGKNISNLSKYDFYNVRVNHLVIKSDKLTTIKKKVFSDWRITNLTIECANLTKIEGDAFNNTIKKASIKAPKLKYIGKYAFSHNGNLREVTIDAPKLTKLGSNVFRYCSNLRKVKFTSRKLNKKSIGSNAFYGTHKKLVIYVPKKKVKTYKKYFKNKGNKNIRVKKL